MLAERRRTECDIRFRRLHRIHTDFKHNLWFILRFTHSDRPQKRMSGVQRCRRIGPQLNICALALSLNGCGGEQRLAQTITSTLCNAKTSVTGLANVATIVQEEESLAAVTTANNGDSCSEGPACPSALG